MHVSQTVIATGGSAVYSAESMQYLASSGVIVYLTVPFAVLQQRLPQPEFRGLAEPKGISLEDLYKKRQDLYQNVADFEIDTNQNDLFECITQIKLKLVENVKPRVSN
jgi:shikimate kinase